MKIIDFDKAAYARTPWPIMAITFSLLFIFCLIIVFTPWLLIFIPIFSIYYLYKNNYIFVRDDKSDEVIGDGWLD